MQIVICYGILLTEITMSCIFCEKKSGNPLFRVTIYVLSMDVGETFLSYIHILLQVLLLKFGNTKTDIPCLMAGAFVS